MRLLTGRGRPAPVLAGGRRALSTGVGLFLIAVGAVLLLAVPAGASLGINLHVAGIIIIVVGVLGLVLPARAQGGRQPGGLRRWINPSGVDDPAVHNVQTAAEEDVREIRESDRLFDPDGPGSLHDEL